MSQSVFLIDCSNIKSQNYKNTRSRSKINAKWNNVVDIQLNQGDSINVQDAILNLKGISSDSTVEILNENSDEGLSDSKVGFRFVPYLTDMGRNTVSLPPVCCNTNWEYPQVYYASNTQAGNYPLMENFIVNEGEDNQYYLKWIGMVTTQDGPNATTAPYNMLEPRTEENDFEFSYGNIGSGEDKFYSPFSSTLKTNFSEGSYLGNWNYGSGFKYILLDENYNGPFRKNELEFWSKEGDCKPQYLDVKVDVNGPIYESPSTISNIINEQLNNSNMYGDNELNPTIPDTYSQKVKLPSITGSLLKNRKCNGYVDDNYNFSQDPRAGKQKLWGQMAVRNINKWMGNDSLVRCDLAFENKINYNSDLDENQYLIYHPCFIMPGGHMHIHDTHVGLYQEKAFFPRIRFNQTVKVRTPQTNENIFLFSASTDYYYASLPKYFLMITNISYTEKNIKRIQKYLQLNEKYDGNFTNPKQTEQDSKKWRCPFDIGMSRQGLKSNSGDDYKTIDWFRNSQGSNNFVEAHDQSDTSSYAYSFPYYPFENPIDSFENSNMPTTRSDIPDLGAAYMIESDTTRGDDDDDIDKNIYIISDFGVDDQTFEKLEVPHRFKNNKEHDASINFFSRYDSDWKKKYRTDNFSNGSNMSSQIMGQGTYYLDHMDMDNIDDSLSKQYGIGVYPVKMQAKPNELYTYDLTNTYWQATTYFNQVNPYNSSSYKITSGSGTQATYGGYDLLIWEAGATDWKKVDGLFIYSESNHLVNPGYDAISGLQYDKNEYTQDSPSLVYIDVVSNGNQFLIDMGNDRRSVLIFDEDDGDQCQIFHCTNYGSDVSYYPFGESISDGFYDPWIKMNISMTTGQYAYIPSLSDKTNNKDSVNNNLPIKTSGSNPFETVCAFMLFDDSATLNGSDWTVSNDFALPNLHQGLFTASLSFFDNPAVWLVNSSRHDKSTSYGQSSTKIINYPNENINYLSVGANNPTFQFDESLSRCTFTNLHNPKKLAPFDMPIASDSTSIVTDTLGDISIKVNDDKIKYNYIWDLIKNYSTSVEVSWYSGSPNEWKGYSSESPKAFGLNHSTGGVFLWKAFGESFQKKSYDFDTLVEYNANNWESSLLNKLGFDYYDLFPKFGLQTNYFDYSKVNNPNPSLRYQMCKPLTTNPLIDISKADSLPLQDYTFINTVSDVDYSLGAGDPNYTVSVGTMQPVNLDGSTSEQIIASDLPQKQASSYFTIYSDFGFTGNYIQNTNKLQVVGIIKKTFVDGDFVYGEQNIPFIVPISQKVTNINIEIRDNNGKLISLDENNSIIFQLRKNLQQQPIDDSKDSK